MSRETEPYDPELEGLLREIAADPRSSLLRDPRARTPGALLERPTAVHPTATGLTTAERHLLEVHRDELADVLRRACLMRFFADPDRAIYLNRSRSAGQELEIDTPEQWRERARAALADARRAPAPLEGLDLLEACLRPAPHEPVSITQLARASQRLQYTDVAEAYVGLDLVISNDREVGERVLTGLVDSSCSVEVRACSLENIALAHGLGGDDFGAVQFYKSSVQVDASRPAPQLAWLFCGLLWADETETRQAASILDDLVGGANSAVDHYISCKLEQRRAGMFTVSERARRLASKLHDSMGAASGRIARALL
jgi:hypothetical protein